jgi:hypothetical protein
MSSEIRTLIDHQNYLRGSGWHFKEGTGLDLPNQDAPIQYSCPICQDVHDSELDAMECRDQPYDTGGMSVGDIVVLPGKWYSYALVPEDPWTAFITDPDIPPDPCVRGARTVPYYVVTSLHAQRSRPHRCLVTLCRIYTGDDGRRVLDIGWNPANSVGHYPMYSIARVGWVGENTMQPLGDQLHRCKPSDKLKEEAAELASYRLQAREGSLI